MSIRKIIIWIFLLIVIDQAIKIVINSFFLESRFEIIPSLLEFKPFFNTKHSYPNSLLYSHFNIDVGLWFHGFLFLIILIVATFFLVYVRNNIQGNKNNKQKMASTNKRNCCTTLKTQQTEAYQADNPLYLNTNVYSKNKTSRLK